MIIYLMYFLIALVSILIIFLIKDKQKALKLLGFITILSSLLIIVLSNILNIIINSNITFINISIFSNYLLKTYTKNSTYLLFIGLLELIISKYIFKTKKL